MGKFLASNVLKTWNEDFIDESTGEVVTIVRTKDVDTAKVVITAWINAKVKERTERDGDERKVIDLSILSASPFACNAIVDKAFCLAYREQEV